MADLFLHDWQRDTIINDVPVNMAVPQTVYREHFEISPFCIFAVHLLQIRLGDVFLKYLTYSVFGIMLIPASSWVK